MKKNNYKNSSKFTPNVVKGGESSTVEVSDSNNAYKSEAVIAKPLEVVVYNNAVDKALRAFRALVQKERILSTYKEKQSYEKPSDRKRRKRNETKRKLMEINSSRERYHKVRVKNVKSEETRDQ